MGFFDNFFQMKPKMESATSSPYAPAQDYYNKILSQANNLYNTRAGSQQYQGDFNAPLDPTLRSGLNQQSRLAGQAVPGLKQGYGYALDMLRNDGMTTNLNNVAGLLGRFANGGYQEDPRLQAAITARENRAANAAATRYGGGRYGSAGIGRGSGDAVAEAGNDLMLQSNESARNRELQAQGLLGNLYESGLGRAQSAAGMLPGLNDLRYSGADRMKNVGDYYQNRAQGERNFDIQQWNQQQAYPWQNLQNYFNMINGVGQAGKQTTGQSSQQMSPFQQIAGSLGLLGDVFDMFKGGGRSSSSFTPQPGQVPVGGPGWGFQG